MTDTVKIFDTTLRDGEQSPGASMTVDQKVEMALVLERLGVDRIEAGFPVSSPIQFDGVRKIGKAVTKSTIAALARCVEIDINAARDSLQDVENRMIHLFIATSPIHREHKLKMSKKQILESIEKHLAYAGKYFDTIEFSAEDASRTEPEFLVDVIRKAIGSGATTINIPDTVGYSIPSEFAKLIGFLRDDIREFEEGVALSVHCHNDLGLAVANSIAAIQHGATQVEVTLNGIGERAGNCSLEELVMALKTRQDMLGVSTNIKTELLYPASKLLQNITGMIIARNKPIFGDNAFAHEAGIHQDGVLKNRETYEIMKPEAIGRSRETLVMGRHSGKHSFKEKMEQYHISLTPEQLEAAFEKFTRIADLKKEVYDEDLVSIAAEILGNSMEGFKLDYFHTYTGNTLLPAGTVELSRKGNSYRAAATGDGPVDAVLRAIDSAIDFRPRLKEYQVHSIGYGKDAQGQVKMIAEIEGESYVGKGSSTDVVEASALAYLNAINTYLFRHEADDD